MSVLNAFVSVVKAFGAYGAVKKVLCFFHICHN